MAIEDETLLRKKLGDLSEPPLSITIAGLVNHCHDMRVLEVYENK